MVWHKTTHDWSSTVDAKHLAETVSTRRRSAQAAARTWSSR